MMLDDAPVARMGRFARSCGAALIVSESDTDRIPRYNYNIAQIKGESFLTQHGAELAHFPMPLFPGGSRIRSPKPKTSPVPDRDRAKNRSEGASLISA
jgi:hypothetical protein